MSKKARKAPKPEELVKGTVVVYWGDKRGIVREAYAPLDEFWVADEQTNDLVRDQEGIVAFKSKDLQMPSAEIEQPEVQDHAARVLVVGNEDQMLAILQHFGAPSAVERQDPQQILAIPCVNCRCGPSCARFDPCKREMCEKADCPMLQIGGEGIDDSMRALAHNLRPDIHVDVRPYHLKQAMEQIGPDLTRLEGYYCLSAVTFPFAREDVAGSRSEWERYWKEEVRCQIDLGVSAEGVHQEGEGSIEDTARRILQETCGVVLSDSIWSEDSQFKFRHNLGIDLPLKFFDGQNTKVFVILIPEGSESAPENGLLHFKFSGVVTNSNGGGKADAAGGLEIGGKTINQWKQEQDQFKGLPKLPAGWIRIKSRKSEEVYYYDTRTHKSTFDFPLPEGWTKQTSKSTGKTYYFNAKKRKSMFDIPTE